MRFRCIERHSSKYRKDHLFQALDGGYGWIIVLSAGVCQVRLTFIKSLQDVTTISDSMHLIFTSGFTRLYVRSVCFAVRREA